MQPIHLFCLTGALNLSNTLAGRHQQCTQLAVRTGQRLGSGGFGCVAAAVLDPSSRHVVGLPGKFVLKVARFGEVLPSHKLHILPKSVFVSTAEHSLSLAADEAHVLQVYGAFLAVARVGEQEAAAVAAVQRPADPGAGRTLTPHSAAIIIDSSSCGGGGVGAAGGTEAAATEAGGCSLAGGEGSLGGAAPLWLAEAARGCRMHSVRTALPPLNVMVALAWQI